MVDRLFDFDDFEAAITIRSFEAGGRRTPVFNGIRWDIKYDLESEKGLWMVWPEFMTSDGASWPRDKIVPANVPVAARMLILNDELRCSVHRKLVQVGLRFWCQEGGKRVADGVVTRITGLHEPRVRAATRPSE